MRSLMVIVAVIIWWGTQTAVVSQGLFENPSNDSASRVSSNLTISGYGKGTLCGGRNSDDQAVISATHGQLALRCNIQKSGMARLFAETRLNGGAVRDSTVVGCDVREAWVSVTPGFFDIRLGRQIVVWGRADAINPTNTITPRDETALSSEYDDTRLSNELLQIKARIGQANVQGIWIPRYRPDVLPIGGADIPAGITIARPMYPDIRFKNGGYALRMEYTNAAIDGSFSYFDGYPTLPGFDVALNPTSGLLLVPRAYRIRSGGLDFSTTMGSMGIRGEAAVRYPYDDYEATVHIPHPYTLYVLGLDRSMGNWNAIFQYSGRYVFGYEKIADPVLTDPYSPAAQAAYAFARASAEIKRMNRLFTGTDDRIGHAITGTIQWNALYETLRLKFAGMYDITTRDYAVNPDISYDLADAVTVTAGGRYINGPEGRLNRMISDLMSFVYVELKVSF